MKKIKFRGIAKCNAQPVFGDLVHYKGQIGINDYFVYPESVAQFVGYDMDENEIYSDDKIIVYDNKGIPPEPIVGLAGDIIKISDIGKTFEDIELLEKRIFTA